MKGKISTLYELIRSDIDALYGSGRWRAFANPSIHACVLVRIICTLPFFYLPSRILLLWLHGIDIGRGVSIGCRLRIPHPTSVVIGAGCVIGNDFTIYQGVTVGSKRGCYPCIGNNVTIYSNAVVVGKVSIGENAVIGALAFVDKDIESNSIIYTRRA